jgi:hypothetical protein
MEPSHGTDAPLLDIEALPDEKHRDKDTRVTAVRPLGGSYHLPHDLGQVASGEVVRLAQHLAVFLCIMCTASSPRLASLEEALVLPRL